MLSFHGRQHDVTTASVTPLREKLTFEPDNLHETGTIVRADTTRLRIRERRAFNRLTADGGWRVEPRLRGDKIETNGFEEAIQSLPTTEFRAVNLPRRPKINADALNSNFSGTADATANDPEYFSTYNLDSLDFLWLKIRSDWARDAAESSSSTQQSAAATVTSSSTKRVKSSASVNKPEKPAADLSQHHQPRAVSAVCSEHDLRVTLSLLELEANELIMSKISAQIDACRKVKTSLGLMLAEQDALKRWRSWSKNIARFVDFKTIAERSRVSLEVTTEIFSYWLLKRYHHGSFYLAKNCTEPQRFDVERIRWQIFLLVIRGWLRNLRHDGERMRMLNDGLIRVKKLRKRLFQKRTELHRLMIDVVEDVEFEACFADVSVDAVTRAGVENHSSDGVVSAGSSDKIAGDDEAESDDAANDFIERLLGVCDVVDDNSLLPPLGTPTTTTLLPGDAGLLRDGSDKTRRNGGRKAKKRRLTSGASRTAHVAGDVPTISTTSEPLSSFSQAVDANATTSPGNRSVDECAVADRPPSPRALRKRVRLMLAPPSSSAALLQKKQHNRQLHHNAVPENFAGSSDDRNAVPTADKRYNEKPKRRNMQSTTTDDDVILLDEIAEVVANSASTSGNSSTKTMPPMKNSLPKAVEHVEDDDSRSMGYNSLSGASIDGDEVVVIGQRRREGKRTKSSMAVPAAAASNGDKVAAGSSSRKKRRRSSTDADADSSVVIDESSDDADADEMNGEDDDEHTVADENDGEGEDAVSSDFDDGEQSSHAVSEGSFAESGEENDIDSGDDENVVNDADVADEPEGNATDEDVGDEENESSSGRSRSRASSAVAASVASNDDEAEEFQSIASVSTYTSARSRRSLNNGSTSHHNKHQRTAAAADRTPVRRVKNSKTVARFVAAQHAATTARHTGMPTTSSRTHLAEHHQDHHSSNKLLGGLALGRVNNDALALAASSNVRLTRSAQQQSLALYEKQRAAAEGEMHAVDVDVLVKPQHAHKSRPPPVVAAHHGYLRQTYHRLPPQTRR